MIEVMDLDLYYDDDEDGLLPSMPGASSGDVLVACLNQLGRVDLVAMSQASGMSCEQLVLELGGVAIFQDPAVFKDDEVWSIEKGWLYSSQYCCGNIQHKLDMALKMNKRFPGRFEANATALKRVLPCPLNLAEIHVALGAPWVPAGIYAQFAKELLELEHAPYVFFEKKCGYWRIKPPQGAERCIKNTDVFGVPRPWPDHNKGKPKPYIDALKILEQTMNNKSIRIYVDGCSDKGLVHKAATLMGQERQKALIREFVKWLPADQDRRLLLEECYNDAFMGFGVSTYDGSFLQFPELNPEVTLYPHQRNAIARMLLSKENLLLAHDVGTGKTYEMCVGVHELYRTGISKKNLVVVPPNRLMETAEAHRYLYPNDRILVVSPKEFTPQHRQAMLEQVRDGDYVAIYIGFHSFDKIVMSKTYWVNKMTAELRSVCDTIATTSNREEKRLLERKEKRLRKELSDYVVKGEDTPWLPFEQLGIETLVVDEAHCYKNIPMQTRAENIVGMHTKGSAKCKEMLEKTQVVNKVVFATGTPITNSLADLFVMQMYLQPEELKFRHVDTFDMWLNVFGERKTEFELDVSGTNLRAMTRFSAFHNLVELMMLFSNVCDFYHQEEDNASLPGFNGYTNICVPKTQEQEEYIKSLAERIELVRSHQVKRTEDNLLKITVDGRRCALGQEKVKRCAQQVYELYLRHPDSCQVVFSDIGTPQGDDNVYDSLKNELMSLGIPEYQIAFVHDATTEAARKRLFAAINAGFVRVVIGSTAKLGVGVNIQERLVALHHLSVPWRPADMVQREGRILRQGNTSETVQIYRYITEGTFDAYSWQLLESKQRFVSHLLSATLATRDAEDVAADAILNYAEVKALAVGNPLIKKRVEVSIQLERAKIACRERQTQLINLQTVANNAPAELERLHRLHETTVLDVALYKGVKETIPQEERVAFGEELLEALQENHKLSEERLFDTYQGVDVCLPAGMDREHPYVYLRTANGGLYHLKMETDKPLGCAMRIDRFLEELSQRVTALWESIRNVRHQRDVALADLEQGNAYQQEVDRLEAELDAIDHQLSEPKEESA